VSCQSLLTKSKKTVLILERVATDVSRVPALELCGRSSWLSGRMEERVSSYVHLRTRLDGGVWENDRKRDGTPLWR